MVKRLCTQEARHWRSKRKDGEARGKKGRQQALVIRTTASLGIKEHHDGLVNLIYIHMTYSKDKLVPAQALGTLRRSSSPQGTSFWRRHLVLTGREAYCSL